MNFHGAVPGLPESPPLLVQTLDLAGTREAWPTPRCRSARTARRLVGSVVSARATPRGLRHLPGAAAARRRAARPSCCVAGNSSATSSCGGNLFRRLLPDTRSTQELRPGSRLLAWRSGRARPEVVEYGDLVIKPRDLSGGGRGGRSTSPTWSTKCLKSRHPPRQGVQPGRRCVPGLGLRVYGGPHRRRHVRRLRAQAGRRPRG